ncbi:MAG: phosphatase PAP2 family protein [Bacteroidales bacterium]|nr:phosphatase PAP2 family protein [Bacteroidales bacterium]
MSFIESIEKIDRDLFLSLNACHSPFFDQVMEAVSQTFIWIPLYLFVLFLIYRKLKWQVLAILPVFILGVVLSDQISVYAFKEVFERFRPCHNLDLVDLVHTVNGKCGGKFGFVSSHAANTFMFAALSSLFIRKKWFIILIFFWAVLVSYSRIYLGVHYPGDVFFGAVLGLVIGVGVFYLYTFIYKKIKA